MATHTETDLERFAEGFRNEHRAARDIFLGIGEALRRRDPATIGELMAQADAGIGPHMRYEEEVMYPALAPLYGQDYVERMLEDHDRAYGVAGRLMELASHDPITDGDIEEGNRIIQGLLPHVTDCDGLVLAIEVLPSERQRELFEARDHALAEGLTMMQWGERRGRPPAPAG
ncbi:MAG: hemerythrin domain-containing protein [Actinomycetota bacterium]|nr:hemerythrin domain-containing protein [Actinomycetota bacterium]